MNRWFYFNFSLLGLGLFHILRKNFFTHWQIPLLFGLLSLLFLLFNWTRHAMYSTIRESTDRQKKIKYAQISKKAIRIHKWTGTTALLLALIHGYVSWQTYAFSLYRGKIILGLISLIVLFFVVLLGWMRHFRPSLKKRYWHLYLGMTMVFLVFFHLLLQG